MHCLINSLMHLISLTLEGDERSVLSSLLHSSGRIGLQRDGKATVTLQRDGKATVTLQRDGKATVTLQRDGKATVAL